MKTLILIGNDSSAGRLKASKAADRVIALTQRLVEGPLPGDEAETAFFGPVQLRHEIDNEPDHWQSAIGFPDRRRLGLSRPSLIETCEDFDRIEIWADPDPNSYLILLQLIEAIKSHPEVLDRLSLAFPSRYIGELSATQFEKTRPILRPLTSIQLDLVSRAWQAHHSHTPKAWFSLLKQDLAGMPGLHSMILRILAELPATKNGLGASEAMLLSLIKVLMHTVRGHGRFRRSASES